MDGRQIFNAVLNIVITKRIRESPFQPHRSGENTEGVRTQISGTCD